MSTIRIGLNGFGRIGRYFTRLALQHPQIEIVVINDLMDIKTATHLLKYDSVHGKISQIEAVDFDSKSIRIGNQRINYVQSQSPADIPWNEYKVDFVVEATGKFLTREKAEAHLKPGVKKVILSAPSPDNSIPMIVMGINENSITSDDKILSNASCTTNSAAPLIAVMQNLCEIESAYITTVHSYTTDQRLHDSEHKDLRRARAAGQSIVPTTTGAAKALTRIFPELDEKLGGCGIRVPVPDGSLTDITMIVNNPPSIEQINSRFLEASRNEFKGLVKYTNDPVVSVDVLGEPYSCVFDSELTSVIGSMVKVVAWYDNEAGYSNRLIDLILYLSEQ
jgi:glyceraldehyde 3-phosphate dehydrogenase